MKKLAQPTRSFFRLKISWKASPGWLQLVFHFGTENREEQLKKAPCICRLVMKSAWWHFDKAPISSLTKFWQDVHFHAFTLLFCRLHLNIWSNGQLLNKRRHEKNHKHKESKLRLNTTLPLLSRLRLTKAGRSNNYSAQTSGFFRCPLIFIFSLHHHPH